MKSRRTRKFWKQVITLFAVYAVIVPLVFVIADSHSASKHFNKAPGELILILAGIAFGISLLISIWQRKDPELRNW
jgi:hypothetical protein